MIVAPHLHLALFCLVNFQVWTREDRAWVVGAKDEIDLDFEGVQELIDLGLVDRQRTAQKGANVGNTRLICEDYGSAAAKAFDETFADHPLPEHPGLWVNGDWDEGVNTTYEIAPEGSVRGENGVFEHDDVLNIPVRTPVPQLRNAFCEDLRMWGPTTEKNAWYPRFRGSKRRHNVGYADASMLATLRCLIEDEVYSAGHLYCVGVENKFKGTGKYAPILDSSALYVMLRFGMAEVTREYEAGISSEGYGATDLGRKVYEILMANYDKLADKKRYEEIAKAMGW
jgi:hypothetical protein